jgi:hypothetical protein
MGEVMKNQKSIACYGVTSRPGKAQPTTVNERAQGAVRVVIGVGVVQGSLSEWNPRGRQQRGRGGGGGGIWW